MFTDSDYNKNDPYDKRNFTKYTEQLMYFASNTKSYAWKNVKAVKIELWKIIDQLEEEYAKYDRRNEMLTYVQLIEKRYKIAA